MLRDVQYLGSDCRARVDLDDGSHLLAHVPSEAATTLAVDTTVRLTWPRRAAFAVADTGTISDLTENTTEGEPDEATGTCRLTRGGDAERRRQPPCSASALASGGVATASTDTTEPTRRHRGAGEETDYHWTPNADLLAAAEDEVNVIAWAGYIEDGSTDPAVDWVTPFEDMTGCAVNVQLGNSSDEMVHLMQSGEYDGVSASGDATERLIAGGEVGPLDVSLISSYEQIFDDLKLQQWNSVDGEPYGIPHGRGANLLVYNTDAFADAAPDSWGVMFEGGTPADGAVSVYDSPDLHRRRRPVPDGDPAGPRHHQSVRPRRDAVRRRDRPARAARGTRRPVLGAVHRPAGGARGRHRARRDHLAGDRQPRPANGATIDAVKPVEGDRVVGHLDGLGAGGEPQLHVAVDGLDHVAVGQRPGRRVVRRGAVEPRVVRLTANPDHCAIFHAEETEYWEDVWYWTTATEECLDGRTDVDLRALHRVGQRLERAAGLSHRSGEVLVIRHGWGHGTAVRPRTASDRGAGQPGVPRRQRLAVTALIGPRGRVAAVVYIGSLVLLVVSAFFRLDGFTGEPTSEFTIDNVGGVHDRSFLDVVVRSVGIALGHRRCAS